jgi:hypothetical protein
LYAERLDFTPSYEECTELLLFPHIIESALMKNTTIQFDSLKAIVTGTLIEGKFEWITFKKPPGIRHLSSGKKIFQQINNSKNGLYYYN